MSSRPAADLKIVPLREADLDAAAQALAAAFHEDPLQTYVFPDPEERSARSPEHFALILKYGLRFGEVFTTEGRPLGAAVWLPPGEWEVTPERAAEVGLDNLGKAIGEAPAERFLSALEAIEPLHHQVPEHWYLMVLGVSPDAKGLGLGRALIEPMLSRAQQQGLPCYLETAQPRNVTFYEYLGFRQMASITDPRTGLPLWTFLRNPGG
jgi:GNAT superfamily N-acetyltransferase